MRHDGTPFNDKWPKDGEFFSTSIIGYNQNIIFADINNDNKLDIITGSSKEIGIIFAWNSDGSGIEGWPVDTGISEQFKFGSVGDINNDGKIEVIATGDNCVLVYSSSGVPVEGFSCDKYLRRGQYGYSAGDVVIGNLNNDETPDILPAIDSALFLGRYGYQVPARFYAFNNNGEVTEGFPLILDDLLLSRIMPIGDLDGDGNNEIVAYTNTGNLYVFSMPGNVRNNEWPQYQHDAQHTGAYTKNIPPKQKPIIILPQITDLKLGSFNILGISILYASWNSEDGLKFSTRMDNKEWSEYKSYAWKSEILSKDTKSFDICAKDSKGQTGVPQRLLISSNEVATLNEKCPS